MASFWKPEACGQTVLPDRSVLIGQKMVENAKIQKFKCDILTNFQTICGLDFQLSFEFLCLNWFSSAIWDLFVWFSNTVYYYPLTFEPNVRAVLRSFSEFTVMGKGDFLHINFLEYKRERKETRCWWLFISRFAWTMRWHPLTNWTWKSCQTVRWANLRHIR